MRVLLINKFHYLKGGAERAYFDTAHILAENGHAVAFFSMAHPENFDTPWSRFFVSRVDYHDQAAGRLSKLRAAARIVWNHEAAIKLEALIEEFKPEVAHLHNTYHQLSPSIIWTLRKHRIRIVMTLHDYKLISPNYSLLVRGKIWDHTSGWRAILDRAVQDSYLKSAICAVEKWFHALLGTFGKIDAFIAPSHFLIERFRAAGFPHPIRHMVQPIRPFPEAPTTRGGDYLLFIGRLSEEKGVGTLIEASARMQGDIGLKIIGAGPEETLLRDQAKSVPGVEFLGYQTGAAWEQALQGAKALVVPSIWYENMPYVVLEALSRGKPVIATRLGGVPERIQEGENGWLFEAGDSEDLVRAVRSLMLYPEPDKLARAAYESIADARPEAYYANLLSVYQGVEKNG
jgi:glycosyltransferase involved in cell wall biosynthesis